MSLNATVYYRLTNNYTGPNKSLDVIADGSGNLTLGDTGNYTGQYWRLQSLGSSKYSLSTAYLGVSMSLDVINDNINNTPHLTDTANNLPGQYWTLTPLSGSAYKLHNDFTGRQKCLDVIGSTTIPILANAGAFSGQEWILTPLFSIPQPDPPMPNLDPKTNTGLSLGPTDFNVQVRPIGIVTAVMVFVDFPDTPQPRRDNAYATATHLLGAQNEVRNLFRTQSYGKLDFSVTVRADLGWRRMPSNGLKSNSFTFAKHKQYIAAAANLFKSGEVNFSNYNIVFIVAPSVNSIAVSPTFIAGIGNGAASPSGEILHAVTFGEDSYRNRYINLVHEVGHVFGDPDLYTFGARGADDSVAGCWGIMSDIFRSVSFLGWMRYKHGWLDANRIKYITYNSGQVYNFALSPLRVNCGTSMVVISTLPSGHRPSKVLVVEVVERILGTNNQYWGDGVLVYTVDATILTGRGPLAIVPRKVSFTSAYGNLCEAAYGVGDVMTYSMDGVTVQVRVTTRFSGSGNGVWAIDVVYIR